MMIVVIVVLALVLAFPAPPYPWLRDPAWVIAAAGLATMLPPAITLWVSRRSIGLLDDDPGDPVPGQVAYARGMRIVQWLVGLLHAALLCGTTWMGLCRRLPLVGSWPLVGGLAAAIPLLVSVVLTWIAAYPAERAIRQISLEVRLVQGRPAHPVWALGQYLLFNLRHQVLFILAPMALILLARDVIEMYEAPIRRILGHDFAPDLLLGAAALLVALIAPVILRYVWVTAPLATGPLRDQLEFLCRKIRMHCRDILVWKSGGMITNAAVMGVVPPLRYVLITDGMLEQLEDRKIEAVFGHEAGHVKRHHILYLLLFAMISGCLVTVLGARAQGLDRTSYQIALALVGGLLLFKWGVVFGWISRRFERQADLFGVRTLVLTGLRCDMTCPVHHPSEAARSGDPICRSAAHLFGDTLNEVARLNNIPPEAWSWRHGSIAARSRVLQKYAMDPGATARFERSVRHVKLIILAGAALSAIWAVWELRLWTLLGLAG